MLVKYNSFGLAKINALKVVYCRHKKDKIYHIDIIDVFFFFSSDITLKIPMHKITFA